MPIAVLRRIGGYLSWLPPLLLAGCATAIITPATEEQIGGQMDLELQQQIGLYQDASLSAYVDAVGKRLVAAMEPGPYTFRFHIVDQGEPNAFATPGGYIYISRGLLAQLNSEAELAGILAHEISHVTRRHHAKQVGKQVGAGLLTLPGAVVGIVSEDLGNMINAPIEVAGQVVLASYSRGQESEADAYGMRLAAAAGYDPSELADALLGIERTVEVLTGEQYQATFFDTHPTTPTRVADIDRQAASLSWQAQLPLTDRAGLYQRLSGLWWGTQNPQQGIFQAQTFLSSDLDITITFPENWKTINTPMFVGAGQPDGGAYVALGTGERVEDPSRLADALAHKMYEEAGIAPTEQSDFRVGEWPAALVRYDDDSGAEQVSLYYLFVTAPRETFTLMAMGLESYRKELRQTAGSLRELSPEEEKTIGGLRLRTAERHSGESLEAFNRRVGNRWPGDLTAAINGIGTDVTGRRHLLKIARYEQY